MSLAEAPPLLAVLIEAPGDLCVYGDHAPGGGVDRTSPGNVWSGNLWDVTGAPIPPDG
jgi:hypothetical protein